MFEKKEKFSIFLWKVPMLQQVRFSSLGIRDFRVVEPTKTDRVTATLLPHHIWWVFVEITRQLFLPFWNT